MKVMKFFTSLLLMLAVFASCITCIKSFRIKPEEIIAAGEVKATAMIKSANSEAATIIADADEEVSLIISSAEEERERLIAEAKAEAEAEAQKQKMSSPITSLSFPLQITDEEREYLYRICYSESGIEGELGMQAVCWTILNRVVSPLQWFPDTIESVIFAPGQYDPVSNGTFYSKTPTQACKDAVDEVLAGNVPDPTGGATYFVMPGYDTDSWWDTLIFCGYMGGHNFYRDPY